MRQDSDSKFAQIETARSSMSPCLPEPPAMRERLVQEIQFFVEYIRQKAEERGQSTGHLLTSPDNKDIIDYVARSSLKGERELLSRGSSASAGSTCSRPMSAVSSKDGRETPLRLHTPSSTSEDGRCNNRPSCMQCIHTWYMYIHPYIVDTLSFLIMRLT